MTATGARLTVAAAVRTMARIDVLRARGGDFDAHRHRAGASGHAGGEPSPACQQWGAALMPAPVLQAQRRHLQLEAETVAWDMAFYSVGFAAGDRILTAEAEYLGNSIAFLPVARAQRRRRRRRAERSSGRARCRGARTHDRSARQADRHHACADQMAASSIRRRLPRWPSAGQADLSAERRSSLLRGCLWTM